MTLQVRCILCEGSQSILIQQGVRYSSDLEVRQCTGCTLVFLSPLPAEDTLRSYYGDQYRVEFESPPCDVRFHNKLPAALLRLGRLQQLLHRNKRLLEIGSDVGAFLSLARPYVDGVTGVEMDNSAREWSRRSGMTVAERLSEVVGTYDIAVMFHVLEHLPDPLGFLREIRTRIVPGGALVIEIPNVDDALLRLYNVAAYQKFYYQRPHLYYFSPETARRILAKSGYEVETMQGVQRYDLSNHMHWMLAGEPGGHRKYADLFGDALNQAYEQALNKAGYTDTLWIVARPAPNS